MSGARYARTVLARALTVACVALLCLFGAGPAVSTASALAADSRSASSAPAEPTEGQSDGAADSDARAAVRTAVRTAPTVRRLPPGMFHVKHVCDAAGPPHTARGGAAAPAESLRTVRSVVLRC
ncbi:hypothetical protein ABTX82_24100 [Streptomyces lavendulae]|uniref:hypothetical protein n=1 Tax=Streptomyces lavendulae TaxID=1914 RepID=UPI0024A57857|nr:hypothetical protein [Streptomyces lavendulae]GLV98358.1 hypothetical protein Slala05_19900 [Streptomyces lavendulae subsp. lavendulae]